jgi:hypothetical protein
VSFGRQRKKERICEGIHAAMESIKMISGGKEDGDKIEMQREQEAEKGRERKPTGKIR